MAESVSIQFSITVRTLGRIANQLGYVTPQFRCPPPSAQYQRSVRRNHDDLSISIVIRGRPWLAVLADIVEGFVIANAKLGQDSEIRNILWDTIGCNDLQVILTFRYSSHILCCLAREQNLRQQRFLLLLGS